jgi:hypothetical protein
MPLLSLSRHGFIDFRVFYHSASDAASASKMDGLNATTAKLSKEDDFCDQRLVT